MPVTRKENERVREREMPEFLVPSFPALSSLSLPLILCMMINNEPSLTLLTPNVKTRGMKGRDRIVWPGKSGPGISLSPSFLHDKSSAFPYCLYITRLLLLPSLLFGSSLVYRHTGIISCVFVEKPDSRDEVGLQNSASSFMHDNILSI